MSFDTVALRARGPLIRVRRESYSGLTRVVLEFVPVQPGNSRFCELCHRMLNHPRQSPTVHPCCSYFPVFSSPTATFEVVGNTGNMSSEKPNVASSGGFLINFIRRNLAKCDRKNQTKSPTAITHDSMMWPTVCRRGSKNLGGR